MDKNLSVLHGLLKDGHIFMVDLDSWFLIDYDIDKSEHHIMANLQKKDIFDMCWFVKVLDYKDSFICVQRNSKEIVIYSPEQGVLRYGEEYEFGEHIDRKYIDAYIYDDNLILERQSQTGRTSAGRHHTASGRSRLCKAERPAVFHGHKHSREICRACSR